MGGENGTALHAPATNLVAREAPHGNDHPGLLPAPGSVLALPSQAIGKRVLFAREKQGKALSSIHRRLSEVAYIMHVSQQSPTCEVQLKHKINFMKC